MAEQLVVVCDTCGKAPAQSVAITADGRSYRKDLCTDHLAELLANTHPPRRGRSRASTTAAPSLRTQARRTKRAAAKRAAPAKGRGRPRTSPAAGKRAAPARKSSPRPRRKITDPKVLATRRASLEKARAARAAKRAAVASAR